MVMIHGYTVDHRLLLPLDEVFSTRPRWRRLYPDLPGHGRSGRLETTSAATMTAAVVQWIGHQIGDEPFALVGHSFGGQLARAATAHFGGQVLGSALVAPVVRWGEDRALPAPKPLGFADTLAEAITADHRDLFTMVMADPTVENWSRFRTHLLPGWTEHNRDAAAELETAFLLEPWPEARTRRHGGAHLLIVGRGDVLVGWRDQIELLDYYQYMTALVLDGVGHNPHLESPEVVGAAVGRWLDGIGAS